MPSPSHLPYEAFTPYDAVFQQTSGPGKLNSTNHIRPQLPAGVQFATSPLSVALLTESQLVSFPAGTKIFQFPACAIALAGDEFGNLGFNGCMRLPRAYRSWPRPSSHPEPSHPLSGVKLTVSVSLHGICTRFFKPMRRYCNLVSPPIAETPRPASSLDERKCVVSATLSVNALGCRATAAKRPERPRLRRGHFARRRICPAEAGDTERVQWTRRECRAVGSPPGKP